MCRRVEYSKAEDVQESIGRGEPGSPEVSVVIPCLNEAETLATCIEKAARAMREHGITGEIVVADNGSSDDSRAIARRLSAIVVDVESKGYGHALMRGIVFRRPSRGRSLCLATRSFSFGRTAGQAVPILGRGRFGIDRIEVQSGIRLGQRHLVMRR